MKSAALLIRTKAMNFENQGSLVDFACGKQLPVEQFTLNITLNYITLEQDTSFL